MYRFLQRNNKKLLAVFAAFLMVVFILPSTFDGQGGGQNPVMGKIGDEEIYASDFQAAEQDWRLLTQLRSVRNTGYGNTPIAYRIGPLAAGEVETNLRLFLLLQREARRMGVGITADNISDFITNEIQGPVPADRQTQDRVRRAVEGLLLIEGAFERAASVIKVSEPALKHEMARRSQNVTVNAVEFPAAAYAEKVPTPTTQQAQAQFEKFAKLSPTVDPKTNPFGFGYRFPNRVKVQYLSIPREDVKKAVEASKSDYEWEVEAQKYYLQNQSQFPVTQPSTPEEAPFSLLGPTSAPATTQGAAATKPAATTRPFEEVRADAKGRIVTPEVERRLTEIQSRIASIMAADYLAFRNAGGGATQPTTGTAAAAPVSSQGVAYNSYDYLQRLAQTIQRDFKVLPTVAAFDDQWRTRDELQSLPMIGATFAEDGSFADYAIGVAEPFVPAERKDDSAVLSLFEPSRPLRDSTGNVYLFRLTAADPEHAAASIAEAGEQVAKDVVAAAAYELAKVDAVKLLDAAKQSGGLKQAAQSAQKSVLTVGPFPSEVRGKLPGLDLKDEANAAFADGAFKLLTIAPGPNGAKPIGLIELAKDGKLYVAELADVAARPQFAMFGDPKSEAERNLFQEWVFAFQRDWFNYENAKQRLGYASTEPERSDRPTAPQMPRQPMF